MTDYKTFFKGKKITIAGLGLLGRGVGDALFLAELGADLTVTDLKTRQQLGPSLERLKAYPNINFTLGKHDLADFRDRDLVLAAPAMPLDSEFLAEARNNGIPVTMSTVLFARFAREQGATIVGVTGTRGKSTTSYLIEAVLKAAKKKTLLGGNVQGISTLALLPAVTSDTTIVLELDSWQLQGFREEKMSPHIAVFTTFYPDHLNYYHADLGLYLADKAEIFLHQMGDDVLILGEQAESAVKEKYGGMLRARVSIARATDVPSEWKLAMPGEHNRLNVACAREAALSLGVQEEVIKKVCESFTGVPGRLQFLKKVGEVPVYNDTTATTPEATVAALRALDPDNKKNIVLIMGGADKSLDMSKLMDEVGVHCKQVLLLPGTGTEKLRTQFPVLQSAPVAASLEEAIRAAVLHAGAGDSVLFSPAFASFGMFTNEYDRGEQFVRAVQSLL